MRFLPLFLRCRGRSACVIGGGTVALRKVRLLHRVGMQVTVVAPAFTATLHLLARQHNITLHQRGYRETDGDTAFLVIAATDDPQLNRSIGAHCRARGTLFGSVDSVEASDYILPTVIDRTPLQIAVTSGGSSPLLARALARHLAHCIPKSYAQLAALLGAYRDRVKRTFATPDERRVFWETVLHSRVADLVFANRSTAAEALLARMLARKEPRPQVVGEVYLVGAGPGDPDLLTLKALRLMQQADVVLYDRLVTAPILALLRHDAEKIYAGKERGNHAIAQPDINRLLVEHARTGRRVLRLKGGDPFIFGRGGEEIDSLLRERIPFQIVPGITAASGCAAYAGIPLTHRDYAHSCVFTTGHLCAGSVEHDWNGLVRDKQTLVFYMGLQGLDQICAQLIAHGMAANTAAAMIARGTTQQQQLVIGTLARLPAQVAAQRVTPPTLLIVGDVVRLQPQFDWFVPARADCSGKAAR